MLTYRYVLALNPMGIASYQSTKLCLTAQRLNCRFISIVWVIEIKKSFRHFFITGIDLIKVGEKFTFSTLPDTHLEDMAPVHLVGLAWQKYLLGPS